MSVLEVEHKGAVDWVTLNRPEALNALNDELIEALRDYFTALASEPDRRIVVLKGRGRAFCAGLDLGGANDDNGDKDRNSIPDGLRIQRRIADIYLAMRRCPQPIISLIAGPACGGGFSLALASDIRIATPDARMNCAYIRIGLGGCDMGSSYFLPRLVGASLAAELILTGKFISTERALQLGLLSRIVPQEDLLQAPEEDIRYMLNTSPMGLRLSKEALNINIDAGGIEAAIALEDRNQILCANSPDFEEGMRAFFESRPPVWSDF